MRMEILWCSFEILSFSFVDDDSWTSTHPRESYEEWSNRMGHEYQAKQIRNRNGSSSKNSSKPSNSYNRTKQRNSGQTAAYNSSKLILQKAKQQSLLSDYTKLYMKYQTSTGILEMKLKSDKKLKFSIDEIPFPGGSIAEKDIHVIRHYVISVKDQNSAKKTLKRERIRWHPDKFKQTFGNCVGMNELVMNRVVSIFQGVDALYKEFVSKQKIDD